ncbi:MAG: caspase family protein [Candidatus Aenigmatarchaeota archaeon]
MKRLKILVTAALFFISPNLLYAEISKVILGIGGIGAALYLLSIYLNLTEQPSIHLYYASFTDSDGNQVLAGNEDGKIRLLIRNEGNGAADRVSLTISIPEKEYKDIISYQEFWSLDKIGGHEAREIDIPIKAKGELPRGKFTIKINCSYYSRADGKEKYTEPIEIPISAAPSAGMVKVAFKNISSEGLPSWIIPTDPEYADYQVSYANNEATILNLNTGERKIKKVASITEAQNYVKDFFLSWDKSPPQIILSSSGGTVNAENVKLFLRLSDDRKLEEMKVYLNEKLFKTEKFTEQTETERELQIPLIMGDNTIRIFLTDWVDKSSEKEIIFTRIRGGSGTYVAGTLPKGEPPPELIVSASPIDGNNTIVGGKEEGIRVSVQNRGRGIAKWVRVILEGDDYLARLWGKERNLEDIKPGETKTATFSILMPTELTRKEAKINVVVREGRGYSPTEIPSLKFILIPAEIVERAEEIIEDVDNDIPLSKTKRERGYALVIGLSRYLNIPAPKYSKNDAEAFSKYISRVFGIANARTIYDENATLGIIKGYLVDWLKTRRGFKIIYFAGHGVPDPENPLEGDVYLLPYDGNPELKSTLLGLREIATLCANPDDTVLLFLDACFSGAEGRTVQLAQRPIVVAKIPESNAITFAAAEGNQPSKEFEKTQHGYFTYYTLLGLKGRADSNNDGWITTAELYRFVKEKVSEATNNVQVPVLRPEREIRIVKLR